MTILLNDLTVLAYIDPATGAIILQVLAAALLSVGVVFRRVFFSPIAATWRRLFGASSEKTPESSEPDLSEQ